MNLWWNFWQWATSYLKPQYPRTPELIPPGLQRRLRSPRATTESLTFRSGEQSSIINSCGWWPGAADRPSFLLPSLRVGVSLPAKDSEEPVSAGQGRDKGDQLGAVAGSIERTLDREFNYQVLYTDPCVTALITLRWNQLFVCSSPPLGTKGRAWVLSCSLFYSSHKTQCLP